MSLIKYIIKFNTLNYIIVIYMIHGGLKIFIHLTIFPTKIFNAWFKCNLIDFAYDMEKN